MPADRRAQRSVVCPDVDWGPRRPGQPLLKIWCRRVRGAQGQEPDPHKGGCQPGHGAAGTADLSQAHGGLGAAVERGGKGPGVAGGLHERDRGDGGRSWCENTPHISEDGQKLFQPEKETVGLCPRCGKPVYEGKKNFACSDRACQFVMWKNDRFFEQRGKTFTARIAAALLKDGKAKVKGVRSLRTGKPMTGQSFWPTPAGSM